MVQLTTCKLTPHRKISQACCSCRTVVYGTEQPQGQSAAEQDKTRLHQAVVVALLSAIPYGVAATGMIVRPSLLQADAAALHSHWQAACMHIALN